MERRLAELRDRLYHAESLSLEREGDIHVLRSQLNVLLSAHTHNRYVTVISSIRHLSTRYIEHDGPCSFEETISSISIMVLSQVFALKQCKQPIKSRK